MHHTNEQQIHCKEVMQQVEIVVKEVAVNESEKKNLWEYEEILSILGFGKAQWILLLISGLLTMNSMSAQLCLGVIAIASKCEFNMSQGEMGLMMTACVTGILLSTYLWGYISDVWGRRTVLILTTFVANILQFTMMFITNKWLFNIINLIMGISLGGISGVIYPYLGEFNTAKNRAIVINYSTMFVGLTSIYVPAISWLVLSNDWSWEISVSIVFKPWRLIILCCLLPGAIGGLLLLPFPESPKLLMAYGKQSEALNALNWISNCNKRLDLAKVLNTSEINLKPEELAAADLRNLGQGFTFIRNIWKSTLPLFHKPHGLNVTLGIVTLFGMMFCSNGLQIWFPDIVNRTAIGLKSGSAGTVCSILDESYSGERLNVSMEAKDSTTCDSTISSKTFIDNIIMGSAFLVGFSIQGILLNPLGRKNVLLTSLTVAAVCSTLLQFVTHTSGILILFCLCILLPGISISVMCGAMVDLVPTYLRGKAVSMGFTLGRLGVILSSNLIGIMLEPYCDGVFNMVTCAFLVSAGLVSFLPI